MQRACVFSVLIAWHNLIMFLRVRARERMFAALQPAKSTADACQLGLEFTLTNGNEYLLLTSD